ncbi:uncharacterized protein [Aegilops tauschii subsp. strangulata]|uniref:uncharacterized protein n=1 Tax=Aegilops tauschii subsp. strangulata TaxID=200361 RepID=UPI003CC8AF64
MPGDGGVHRGWSDLPDDLLHTVYLSCSTAYDRARFVAVCASWRTAASWHRPLLLVSTPGRKRVREAHAYSPEDDRKIVFSEEPSSRGCIAAAIIGNCTIGLCGTGCPESEWMARGLANNRYLDDIVFCKGKLYGLTRYNKQLLKFDIVLDRDGAPEVTAIHRLPTIKSPLPCARGENYCTGHIFELHGRLAMAIEI